MADHQEYIDCMNEIKFRVEAIKIFLNEHSGSLSLPVLTESICLQLRKVLELIALASLAANRSEYKLIRNNFHKDWNAKRILEVLM